MGLNKYQKDQKRYLKGIFAAVEMTVDGQGKSQNEDARTNKLIPGRPR